MAAAVRVVTMAGMEMRNRRKESDLRREKEWPGSPMDSLTQKHLVRWENTADFLNSPSQFTPRLAPLIANDVYTADVIEDDHEY